jgi:hypothetical protein
MAPFSFAQKKPAGEKETEQKKREGNIHDPMKIKPVSGQLHV